MSFSFTYVHRLISQVLITSIGLLVFSSFALAAAGSSDTATDIKKGAFAGLDFRITNATVPPGGLYQLQLTLTEPKPMGMGSSKLTFSSNTFSSGVGAAINSPSGQAYGVILPTINGLQVTFISPDATLGTDTDYPFLTIALPVRPDATIGLQVPVSLDLSSSVFLDGSGQPYATEMHPGTLTIDGMLNINNVLPGGGTVPAGSTIRILGLGFTPSAVVQVAGKKVATQKFVSSNEIDVTLHTTIVLDSQSVTVSTSTQTVTYFSYLRTAEVGQTAQPLLVNADAMFSQVTYTKASLKWVTGSTVFTGLALQNESASPAEVTLQLVSGTQIVQTLSFPLPGTSKMTRDLADFFGQAPAGGSTVQIQSTQPIQLLGIQGDTTAGTLFPVAVSPL